MTNGIIAFKGSVEVVVEGEKLTMNASDLLASLNLFMSTLQLCLLKSNPLGLKKKLRLKLEVRENLTSLR